MRFTLKRTRTIQEEMEIDARSKKEAARKGGDWWDLVYEDTEGPDPKDVWRLD